MIVPIVKIAAEVVRQAAQHPQASRSEINQRVAEQLHIDVALVEQAMQAHVERSPQP